MSSEIPTLAASTLKRYNSAIKSIKAGMTEATSSYCGTVSGDFLLGASKIVLQYLAEKYPNANSRRTYLSAVIWYCKNSKTEYDVSNLETYNKASEELRPIADKQTSSQTLSEKRSENYVEWQDVLAAFVKARMDFEVGDLSILDYTLMALYVLQAPVRLDYAWMSIVNGDGKDGNNKYTKEMILSFKTGNYAVIKDFDTTDSYFVFNDYKTSTCYGQQVIPMSPRIKGLLTILKFGNRQSIFCGERADLSRKIIELWTKYTGKKLSVSLIRHSYIAWNYAQNPSIEFKKDLARRMLHSADVQELYNMPSGWLGTDDSD
jgi:hypothetical protein